ncbi:MAG: aldehyde dehydrogenase [Clostridia bacterium]|nr:aldehyde dehydrogenase [Clostridia bacterium]
MIDKLIKSQREYFAAGKTLNVKTRILYLKKLKKAILANENELCCALKQDLGKSSSEAYMSEIGMVLEDLSHHIKHLKSWAKPKKRKTPMAQFPSKGYLLPSPYGNTLIISPWNYPFLLSFQPLIGAVGAGNTVILKPSRFSEKTGLVMKKIVECVFPADYVAVICGVEGVSQQLLDYKFDYIFFTGGARVGKSVYEAAAKNLTPVTLELGGKSPVIVDKSAKIDLAAKRIAFGKFLNVGQTCVAPDYVLAHNSVAEKFINALKKWIAKLFPDALNNECYGKIITQKHFERVNGLICGNVALGGNSDANTLKIEPTIIYPADTDCPAMQEEIFGPVLPVIAYGTNEEMYEIIEKHRTPLALYLFTSKKSAEKEILSRVQFGGGCVNDVVIHLACSSLPFGGVGGSGIGSYHGKKSFETFSHFKSVLKKSNLIDMPIRYTPYSKLKDRLIRFFMK